MCGVIGFSCVNPNEEKIQLLKKIVFQSKIRGVHSFGYSYWDNEIKTKKYHNINEVEFPIVDKIIYHNRYSTSGDYKQHANNQPIVANNISLVFNGVLDMGTKAEIEKRYKIKMTSDNDGEIINQKCSSNKDELKRFINKTTGSFAGLILTPSNELLAIRNPSRPLWKLNHDNAVYFASTKDIFKRVNTNFEPTQLEPNILYEN